MEQLCALSMEVPLSESNLCRLCAADNAQGLSLFVAEEDGTNLSELINSYLPLKVFDDGKYSRTICPGCTIQLEATVEFFNLIISGQRVLRDVLRQEKENVQKEVLCEPSVENSIYPPDHSASLQMEGLDKPKRKRGRPKKIFKTEDPDVKSPIILEEPIKADKVPAELVGKRRRKAPERLREAVQGKELERILREEGVIDGDESDGESKQNVLATNEPVCEPVLDDVIGHMQTADGTLAGEPIRISKGKGRGRPKGPTRSNKQQCAICGMEYSCVGRYMSHVAQHGRVIYQCTQCEETFTTRLLFNEHQEQLKHLGQNVIKCEDEEQKQKVLEEEMQSTGIIPEVAPQLNQLLGDTVASDPVANEESIQQTVTSLDGSFTINICPDFEDPGPETAGTDVMSIVNTDLFIQNQGVDVHKETDAKPEDKEAISVNNRNSDVTTQEVAAKQKLKCPHCDKLFSSKQSKSLHIRAMHTGMRPYACKECNARFPYPRSLAVHMLTHRKLPQHQGYACDLCGKVLNHPSSVVYHKEAVHAGQKFKCVKCNKLFKHKQLLQRHQLVHTQVRPYSCKLCVASFKTKANLINHQLLHSGVKKYSCETCNQTFAHKTSLTLHMRWHSGLKPYECETCGKSFTQRGNLQEHLRTHTGEKPYVCSECPRRFTTSSQFRLHQRRHTGEKPFTCTHCGKRFVSGEAWRAHMRRELGQLEHWCNVCGRGFAERWAMLKHQRCHTGEKPFACPHCPRAFADCSNLTKHKKIHKAANSLLVKDKKRSRWATVPSPPPEPEVEEGAGEAEEGAGEAEEGGGETEENVIYVTYRMDGSNEAPTFHILDPEQAESLDDSKVLTTCDLYEDNSILVDGDQVQLAAQIEGAPDADIGDAGLEPLEPLEARIYIEEEEEEEEEMDEGLMMEQQHMSVTDEEGNPLQVTMCDGTTIEITSADGNSIQVLTQDGVPLELDSYKEVEDMESSCVSLECVEVADEDDAAEGRGGGAAGGEHVRMLSFDDSTLAQFFTIS